MGRNRKTYSDTFKAKVAMEAIESGKTVAEIASEYGIAPSMVTQWKKVLLNGGFSKDLKKKEKELEESEKALERAKLIIGKQQLMIELLKKKLDIKDETITL